MVLPFKWNLLGRTFPWYYLFFRILQKNEYFFSEFFSHQIRRERVNSSYTWIFHTWPPIRVGSLRLHQMSFRSKDKKIVFVCAKGKSLQDVSNYSKKKHHDTTIMRRHTNINSWLAVLFILRFKTLKGSRVFNVIFFIHSSVLQTKLSQSRGGRYRKFF